MISFSSPYVCLWFPSGFPNGFVIISYGFLMNSHCLSMVSYVFLSVSHDVRMVFLLISSGIPMIPDGFPWLFVFFMISMVLRCFY